MPVILCAGNSDFPVLLINKSLSPLSWLPARKRITNRINITASKLTSRVLPFCPPIVLPTIITIPYRTDICSVVCITAFFSSSLTSSVLVLNIDSFIYSVFLTLAILMLMERIHTASTLTK